MRAVSFSIVAVLAAACQPPTAPNCEVAGKRARFTVGGACGQGEVSVAVDDACVVRATGLVSLPSEGEAWASEALERGGWTLSEPDRTCQTSIITADDGRVWVHCPAGPVTPACDGTLVPVAIVEQLDSGTIDAGVAQHLQDDVDAGPVEAGAPDGGLEALDAGTPDAGTAEGPLLLSFNARLAAQPTDDARPIEIDGYFHRLGGDRTFPPGARITVNGEELPLPTGPGARFFQLSADLYAGLAPGGPLAIRATVGAEEIAVDLTCPATPEILAPTAGARVQAGPPISYRWAPITGATRINALLQVYDPATNRRSWQHQIADLMPDATAVEMDGVDPHGPYWPRSSGTFLVEVVGESSRSANAAAGASCRVGAWVPIEVGP